MVISGFSPNQEAFSELSDWSERRRSVSSAPADSNPLAWAPLLLLLLTGPVIEGGPLRDTRRRDEKRALGISAMLDRRLPPLLLGGVVGLSLSGLLGPLLVRSPLG